MLPIMPGEERAFERTDVLNPGGRGLQEQPDHRAEAFGLVIWHAMPRALNLLDAHAWVQVLQFRRRFRRNDRTGVNISNDEENGDGYCADQLAIVGVRRLQNFKCAQASLQSRRSQKFDHFGRAVRVAGTYVSQHLVLASAEKPAMLLGDIAIEDLALTLGTEEGRINQNDSAKGVADPARDHRGRHAPHRMPKENRAGESELADE